ADVEHIPQFIEVDVSTLEINNSVHLREVKLPKGVKALSRGGQTLVTVVPPSGYGDDATPAATAEGAAPPAAGAAAPAAGAAAPAAGAKAPAAGAKAPAAAAAKAPAGDKKK
ncbi:MAG: 50S ribosomal protein L25, partial [Xanthobacteraceae bacterium]